MTLTSTQKTLLADIVNNGALRTANPPNKRLLSLINQKFLLCIQDRISYRYEITQAGRLALQHTRRSTVNERQLPLPGIANHS